MRGRRLPPAQFVGSKTEDRGCQAGQAEHDQQVHQVIQGGAHDHLDQDQGQDQDGQRY